MEHYSETYNSVHFDTNRNQRLNLRVTEIENSHKLLRDYIIEFLVNADWATQMKHCDIYLKLISKIRFLLDPIISLLPLLQEDYRYKVSLGLLYRGIIDDIINVYYLIAFYDPSDTDQRSLDSELNILHKEFLLAWIEGYDAELKAINTFGGKLDEKQPLEEFKESVRLANLDLHSGQKFKTNKDLRSESLRHLNSIFFQKTAKNGFISEKQKLDFISEIGRSTDNLKALFKYFSQLHHFTPKTHDLQNSDIEYDLQCYRIIEIELMYTLETLSRFIVLKDKDRLLSFCQGCKNALRVGHT